MVYFETFCHPALKYSELKKKTLSES